jgi:hypothetical protein
MADRAPTPLSIRVDENRADFETQSPIWGPVKANRLGAPVVSNSRSYGFLRPSASMPVLPHAWPWSGHASRAR